MRSDRLRGGRSEDGRKISVMSASSLPPNARADSLIEFPSRFPVKVMGLKADGFVEAVTAIASRFDPGFDPAAIELRDSSGGKYLGITVTITARSREQLDDLYRELTGHPMVKVVL
jgi:putative lipoic acid-binding regulatory protein